MIDEVEKLLAQVHLGVKRGVEGVEQEDVQCGSVAGSGGVVGKDAWRQFRVWREPGDLGLGGRDVYFESLDELRNLAFREYELVAFETEHRVMLCIGDDDVDDDEVGARAKGESGISGRLLRERSKRGTNQEREWKNLHGIRSGEEL